MVGVSQKSIKISAGIKGNGKRFFCFFLSFYILSSVTYSFFPKKVTLINTRSFVCVPETKEREKLYKGDVS